jgi:hypothetical protein
MAVKRSEEEKWRKVRVAPSRHALNLMRLRSKITSQRDDWLELFDTNTNTFWYLNKKTAHSTWTPPSNFEIDLFCQWDPVSYTFTPINSSTKFFALSLSLYLLSHITPPPISPFSHQFTHPPPSFYLSLIILYLEK